MMVKKFFLFGMIIFLFGSVLAAFVASDAGHSADEVRVNIIDSELDLQQAINAGFLINDALQLKFSKVPLIKANPGHDVNEIWVSISGEEMTLYEAISNQGLCGMTNPVDVYTSGLSLGHFAEDIEVLVNDDTKSLQDAIDSGDLLFTENYYSLCYDDDRYWYDSCNRRQESKREECGMECEVDNEWYCSSSIQRKKNRTCYDTGCDNDICFYNSYVDLETEDCLPKQVCKNGECITEWLLNKKHVFADCTKIGGVVTSTSRGSVCKFTGSKCPSGWTASGDTTTKSKTCRTECLVPDHFSGKEWVYRVEKVSSCKTGKHSFSRASIESCSYCGGYWSWRGRCTCLFSGKCKSTVTEIGCY
jgi:hypothetical protein